MHDNEFESVLSLPEPRLYEYFIKRVADWGTIWGLGDDDGWAAGNDDEGRTLMPVWPHERYAAACASGTWAGNKPHPIKLEDWIDRWTPGLIQDGLLVSVFPTPSGRSIRVPPERLKSDLEAERSGLIAPSELE